MAHRVDDAAALAFVDHLLERLSARWTVAIATRAEPALRLARLLLHFAARVAAVCGSAAPLREWIARMDELEPRLPGLTPERTLPLLPLRGHLAWMEGAREDAVATWQRALEREEQVDVLGLAVDTRVRLARALADGAATAEAAAVVRPVFERAALDGGPGGALLAPEALSALARLRWGAHLDAAQAAQLARWSACCTLPAAAPAAPAGIERLSPREREVLARIAAGDSNKIIAREFDLSPHTVKRHVANILDKIGVDSRGRAAAWHRAQLRH